MTQQLPGKPGPKLLAIVGALGAEARPAFLAHLLGGTSSDWLSDWLTRAGMPMSATIIREYRRSIISPERKV